MNIDFSININIDHFYDWIFYKNLLKLYLNILNKLGNLD